MLNLHRRPVSRWRMAAGISILASMPLIGLIGTWLSSYSLRPSPTGGSLPPSAAHWLGTDDTGRDILRLLLGSIWPAYLAGFLSISIIFALGSLVGALAGYYRGLIDRALRLAVNILFVIPELLQMLFIIALITPNSMRNAQTWHVILASSLVGIPGYALLVRNMVSVERDQTYVLAAHSLGLPPWRIALRHIFPNIRPPLLAFLAGRFKGAILVLSALSFIGLLYDPSVPHLGQLLDDGRRELMFAAWRIAGPLLVIWLTMLGANLISDAAGE
ncbi:MAG TPA: ABC transporter permease [Herpetosiphonaceae bacterium]|nr:ABC transporter permease [Herpetosiphonaceae bacterium]